MITSQNKFKHKYYWLLYKIKYYHKYVCKNMTITKMTIIINETMNCLTKTCALSVDVLRANSVVTSTTVVLDKNNIIL